MKYKIKNKKKNIKSKLNNGIYRDKYFDQLNEWQEHQFDPGHYIGGNIPPILKSPGRPSVLGWLFVILSTLFCILTLILILSNFEKDQILPITIAILIIIGLYAIQFIAGIRLILKGREVGRKGGINTKKIVLFASIILTSVLLIIGIYKLNNNFDSAYITSMEEFNIKQVNGNNYIYIKSIDKTLSCTIKDYSSLWALRIFDKEKRISFKIDFIWNNVSPKKGKVIKINGIE